MATVDSLVRRFEGAFDPRQAKVLAEAIHDAYNDLVKTSDFNELKGIVRELADAQVRTEARLGELTVAQERTESRLGELAIAQERTESRLESLAIAQERTENNLNDLNLSVRALVESVHNQNRELGGLSLSSSYALENEAYRLLPSLLQERYGIVLDERIVRAEIGGEEINFLARGYRNGQAICLVGEAKLRLDERRDNYHEVEHVLDQLEVKVAAVQKQYPDCEIVRLLVTHFARPAFLERARKQDVIVVQSFEW